MVSDCLEELVELLLGLPRWILLIQYRCKLLTGIGWLPCSVALSDHAQGACFLSEAQLAHRHAVVSVRAAVTNTAGVYVEFWLQPLV